MAKSLHDLSEDELDNLSKEIKELVKEFKQNKNKKNTTNNDFISDDFELTSWLTTTEEFEEKDENLTQKQSKEVKKRMQNRVEEKKSLGPGSSEYSETNNIEDLIKNDETLKELKNLTSVLQNESDERVSKETLLVGSNATLSIITGTEKSINSSFTSTIDSDSNPMNSNTYKTVKSDLRPKTTKTNTLFDKDILHRTQSELKLESASKKKKSLKQQADNISKKDGSESKLRNISNSSVPKKKNQSNKESPKVSDEWTEEKKTYSKGSPEYLKGHYVPIISKRNKFQEIERRRISSFKKRTTSPELDPEEVPPLFPLQIDCISMFSEDKDEDVEEELSEEGSSESSSDPGDPSAMLNQLWQDLLLPTDESDLDLDEFYNQFPKLKKKIERKASLEESNGIHFGPMS